MSRPKFNPEEYARAFPGYLNRGDLIGYSDRGPVSFRSAIVLASVFALSLAITGKSAYDLGYADANRVRDAKRITLPKISIPPHSKIPVLILPDGRVEIGDPVPIEPEDPET